MDHGLDINWRQSNRFRTIIININSPFTIIFMGHGGGHGIRGGNIYIRSRLLHRKGLKVEC
jgi:hypothetical protein